MARRFAVDIDLLGFSLLNALLNPVSSDPGGLGAGDEGRAWYNTTTNKLMYWNGSAAIDATARANHTGTQTASTISDFDTQVRTSRLDQMAAPTASVSLNSQTITNLANGSGANDAVNKAQLDVVAAAAASGISIKSPVRAASTANVTIGSTGNGAVMDGVTLATNDRILLKDQTTGSQNGIYDVGASALTRATDMDATGEVAPGTMVFVREGSVNGDKAFAVSSDAAITVGTTTITWVQITGTSGTVYTAGDGLTESPAGTFNVGAGTGITVNANDVAINTSVVGRRVTGVIPTSSSGIFTVSGAVVTINHALSNSAPRVTLRAYTSPVSGYTQGELVEVGEVATDANNVDITLPANPASNNWFVSILG